MTATFGVLEAQRIMDELSAADAPPDVQTAAKQVMTAVLSDVRPSSTLMRFITDWIAKRGQQNRWGK